MDLLDATQAVPDELEEFLVVSVDIGQLMMAAKFIKQDILKHITRINAMANLNGQLETVRNHIHDETKERIDQFRKRFKLVKDKFYQVLPIADQI